MSHHHVGSALLKGLSGLCSSKGIVHCPGLAAQAHSRAAGGLRTVRRSELGATPALARERREGATPALQGLARDKREGGLARDKREGALARETSDLQRRIGPVLSPKVLVPPAKIPKWCYYESLSSLLLHSVQSLLNQFGGET